MIQPSRYSHLPKTPLPMAHEGRRGVITDCAALQPLRDRSPALMTEEDQSMEVRVFNSSRAIDRSPSVQRQVAPSRITEISTGPRMPSSGAYPWAIDRSPSVQRQVTPYRITEISTIPRMPNSGAYPRPSTSMASSRIARSNRSTLLPQPSTASAAPQRTGDTFRRLISGSMKFSSGEVNSPRRSMKFSYVEMNSPRHSMEIYYVEVNSPGRSMEISSGEVNSPRRSMEISNGEMNSPAAPLPTCDTCGRSMEFSDGAVNFPVFCGASPVNSRVRENRATLQLLPEEDRPVPKTPKETPNCLRNLSQLVAKMSCHLITSEQVITGVYSTFGCCLPATRVCYDPVDSEIIL